MLSTKRLILRALEKTDLSANYVNWLNDHQVNMYLETRFCPQSLDSITSYWETHRNDPNSPWFAICLSDNKKHIGNIKLGPINWIHRRADISLMIGDSSQWGKGYASESISVLTGWAFQELGLYKLSAGIYSGNVGSRRAFEKSGYVLEGTLKDEVYSQGKRHDIWRMGCSCQDWKPQ